MIPFETSDWQLLQTADNSMTLVNGSGVTYHSRHGAIGESRVVYLDAGLLAAVAVFGKGIKVLETGFGTGLNALMTLQDAQKLDLKVSYCSLELFPLNSTFTQQFHYAELLGRPEEEVLFQAMHASEPGKAIELTPHFDFLKIACDIKTYRNTEAFHLVYFDSFAPSAQPELWKADVFRNMYESLVDGGMLLTYCSKSVVRKAMMEAGFSIEKIPGPWGKREILRAVKRPK